MLNTEQIIPQSQSLQALETANIKAVVSAFAASQDVAPSSRRIYASIVTGFLSWAVSSRRPLSELTLADVIAYKEKELAEGKSTLTVSAHVNGIRRFYEWTEANKIYPNIAKSCHAVRSQEGFRHRPLSVRQVGDLLKKSQADTLRNRALVTLMLYTGLRCIEVARANVGDITYMGEDNTRVLMIQGKGHSEKDDFVQLTESAYRPLKEYLDTRADATPAAPLFVAEGNRSRGQRISTRSISKIAKNALKSIGLDGRQFSAHSLRHTAGTNILRAGGSIEQAQQTLRHSNPATTQIYVKMALKERRLTNGGEAILERLYSGKK